MKYIFEKKEYAIDGLLARQLDTLVYNVKKDYDFVIIITGDRAVRVGKSVLAMQVCAYLSAKLNEAGMENKYTIDDIYFDNQEMMEAAFKKKPYHVNHYDEGREGLAANKAMKSMQHDLLDFFAECGQMNHIFVIVAPDFFKLNEEIAVARSEYLINVYRTEETREVDLYKTGTKQPVVLLKRGQFEFFDRRTKRNLYDKAQSTRRRNYGLIKANFIGSFSNTYPLGEEEYRIKKKKALSRFTEKKEEEKRTKENKKQMFRNKFIFKLKNDGLSASQIQTELEKYDYTLTTRQINTIYQEYNEGGEVRGKLGNGNYYNFRGDEKINNTNKGLTKE